MTEAVSPSLYLCKDVILWELHDDSVQGWILKRLRVADVHGEHRRAA